VLVIATALVVLYAFVTTRTVIGRQIYAVGQPIFPPISGRRMMLHKSGVTHSLARFIAATQWDDIDPRRLRRRRWGGQAARTGRTPDRMGARHRVHAVVRFVRVPGHAGEKRWRRKRGAQRGSALLAEQGVDGPPKPFAGVQGFYRAMGETPDLAWVTECLGESWEIMATSYKSYPCGFVIHPVLDCVVDWRRDHPKADVTRVIVRGNPLLSDRTDRPDISTGRESQVSVQHAVAAAMATGKAGLDQFTDACVRDPKVLALRSKVEVLRDSGFSTIAASVEIFTADGNTHRLSQPTARGSDVNPMSDGDIEAKLRAAAGWDPRHDVAPLVDAIWALDKSADVSRLASLAVPLT
jgi:2-methylcitrate dehydratase PrpD